MICDQVTIQAKVLQCSFQCKEPEFIQPLNLVCNCLNDRGLEYIQPLKLVCNCLNDRGLEYIQPLKLVCNCLDDRDPQHLYVQLGSDQFNLVSMHSRKSTICAPPCLSVFPVLPLKQFQRWSD